MDFIPVIEEIGVTATVPVDVTNKVSKEQRIGVIFYDVQTLTITGKTGNTITVPLKAYEAFRLTEDMVSITPSATSTMVYGTIDNLRRGN